MTSQITTTTDRDDRQARIHALLEERAAATNRAATIEAPAADLADGQLSFAQARMWFLHLLDPDSPAYNITSAARLRGDVDTARLDRALRALLGRHPLLRTRFLAQPDGSVRRETLPLDEVASPLVRVATAAQVQDSLRTPFDLGRAPLLRLVVSEPDHGTVAMALVVHHMVADGWTLGILHRHLHDLYRADDPADRSPVSDATHIDRVVRAEQEWVRSPAGRDGLAYWRRQLADLPSVELPMARRRPPIARFAGRCRDVVVDDTVTRRLEELAREQHGSLYMVVVAAFTALLHRYTGQTDIPVGTPVANRASTDVGEDVGLFTNTVVVREDLSGRPSFTTLLERTRRVVLEGLQHQQVPFEVVVDELQPQRTLSQNPLFQVMVAHQNADTHRLGLPGTTSTRSDSETAVSRLDIECTTWRLPEGLRIRLNLSEDLFGPGVEDQLLTDFVRLLTAAAEHPDTPVADLAVFDSGAVHAVPAPVDAPAGLWSWFTDTVGRFPDATAVSDATSASAFTRLRADALTVAAHLRDRGVGPGARVALCLPRDAAFVAAVLGVLATGAAFVPVNPEDPEDRRRFIVEDSDARVVVTTGDLRAWLEADDGREPTAVEPRPAEGAEPAYVIYTSGTTGRPKGVEVAHRSIVNTVLGSNEVFGTGPGDVGLVLAAHTFDVFYYELFSVLLAGGHSRVVSKQEVFTPATIVDLLRRATRFQAVPGLMDHLLGTLGQAGVPQLPGVRQVVTGGDTVPPALLERLAVAFPAADVTITYGPTETAVFATWHHVQRGETGYPIGSPLPGVTVLVADDDGVALPPGVTGEILVGGRGVALGYVNRPDENADRFLERDGERFYRTGDRGLWNPTEERFEFRGRADKQVKIRGLRIELGEVESVLSGLAGVRHGAVVKIGDGATDSRLVAYAVVDETMVDGLDYDTRQVDEWQELFDQTHVATTATRRDFTGWNSSYDGRPMPVGQMDEWVDETLERIGVLLDDVVRAEGRAPRVLELGVGTGLLASELAPRCGRYVGVDFSAGALAAAAAQAAAAGIDHIELLRRRADELDDLDDDFDLVVINSVAQYFPSVEHLDEVLTDVARHLQPRGAIFCGDLRHHALLSTFHASVLAAATGALPSSSDVSGRVDAEVELAVDPGWFADRFGPTTTALPKCGSVANELTKYRYDVVRRLDDARAVRPSWLAWDDVARGRSDVAAVLDELLAGSDDLVAVAGVPNALLADDVALAREVADLSPAPSDLAVSPRQLRELAAGHGRVVVPSVLAGRPDGAFDVVFAAPGKPAPDRVVWPVAAERPPRWASTPARAQRAAEVGSELRGRLGEVLPAYMVPDVVMVLDQFPLTANDKLDRAALPLPPPSLSAGRPPRAGVEQTIATVWSEVIGCAAVSATDDLFQVGATSLTAIRIAVALRERGLEVVPQQLFEHSTVERLADWLERGADPVPVGAPPVRAGAVAAEYGVQPGRPVVARPTSSGSSRRGAPGPVTGAELHLDEWVDTGAIVLTGATGFLGVHLLAQALVAAPSARVFALVRGRSAAVAQDRLWEVFSWHHGDALTRQQFDVRVRAVPADLARPGLGIDPAVRDELTACAPAVIHAAADVRHVAPRTEVYATNLHGTREIVRLCEDSGGARLVHVSTIGVAGRTQPGSDLVLTEADLAIGQLPTEDYSASKIEAEHLLRDSDGFTDSVSVVRVGTVAPHSVTGRFQRNIDEHFLGRYTRGMLGLGLAPDWPGREFRLVPADAMARAVFGLTAAPVSRGTTFHVQSPHPVSHAAFAAVAREEGHRVEVLDVDEFIARVTARGADPSVADDVGRLLPWSARPTDVGVELDTSRTDARLDAIGFEYPLADAEYLRRFLRHGVRVGFLPAPRGSA